MKSTGFNSLEGVVVMGVEDWFRYENNGSSR